MIKLSALALAAAIGLGCALTGMPAAHADEYYHDWRWRRWHHYHYHFVFYRHDDHPRHYDHD